MEISIVETQIFNLKSTVMSITVKSYAFLKEVALIHEHCWHGGPLERSLVTIVECHISSTKLFLIINKFVFYQVT